MKKFKCAFCVLILSFSLTATPPAKADLFGGDVAVLLQILANAIKQLAQLQSILKTGRENLEIMRELHKGLHDALSLLNTAFPNVGSEVYKDITKVDDALREIERIYGAIDDFPKGIPLRDVDRTIAEAIILNNQTFEKTERFDIIGQDIQAYSHRVSSKGAAKLTAQAMGVVTHLLNQTLRAQSTNLKLHAQEMAVENQDRKEAETFDRKRNIEFARRMKSLNLQFKTPRFQ